MKTEDTARLYNLDGLVAKLRKMTAEAAKEFFDAVVRSLKTVDGEYREGKHLKDQDAFICSCVEEMYFQENGYSNYNTEKAEYYSWPSMRKRTITKLRRFAEYSETETLHIGRWEPGVFAYLYLGNPEKGIVVPEPEKYLEIVPGTDYSEISPSELKQALGAGQAGPSSLAKSEADDLTSSTLDRKKRDLDGDLDAVKAEMDDVKNAKTGELAAMQAKIDAMMAEMEEKKTALMAELERKKDEMEQKMETLNRQIFLLDSQIYSILCYNGEIVKLRTITSGAAAPVTEPVVIYQKLRFLDEELGKLASLYTIDWEDVDVFEDLIRHSPAVRDTFAPNPRCVQLIRLSRTGKLQGRAYNEQTGLPLNVLRDYDYYHGKTVGIVLRNGENIYLGWTDEDRVDIQDDFIVDFSKTVETPGTKVEDLPWYLKPSEKEIKEKEKNEAWRFARGYISRQFIFSILQGIVDKTDILPMPEGENRLSKSNPYVVFSMAEGMLEDTRFGTFDDIIKKCNIHPQVGDMLLTTQGLDPEFYSERARFASWNNPRGRGDANRTHDASVDDCALYPLNVIDVDEPVKYLYYKHGSIPCKDELDKFLLETERSIRMVQLSGRGKGKTREDILAMSVLVKDADGKDRRILPPEPDAHDFRIEETTPDTHIFISVEKGSPWTWTGTSPKARANFELYDGEYINLTFLNSVWLSYAISTQKLGGWMVGGKQVEYAHGIRYLKTAIDYIRKREAEEKELIDAVDPAVCQDQNWPLTLSEWKIKHNVHHMTAFQAKRFVKAAKKGDS